MVRAAVAGTLGAVVLLSGCAATVPGTATWPGAALQQAMLTEADFPPGVRYDRIVEKPGEPDGAHEPGSMLSRPQGCANALTNVIKQSAELGPGSAAKYAVSYDGARMVMTVLSWNLDLAALQSAADRCASYEVFFDPASIGIPMTTTALPGLPDGALGYEQTMRLNGAQSSAYMAFQNVGRRAVFGSVTPTPNPSVAAKAELPQTFLEVFSRQATKLAAS
jgi:hypothetical protein